MSNLRITCPLLISSLLATLLSGCATPSNPVIPPAIPMTPTLTVTNTVPERPLRQTTETKQYKLCTGDLLKISLYGTPLSTREVTVDSEGFITYLLTGTTPAAGRTVDELRAELQAHISQQLNDILVGVSLVRTAGQRFTIRGQLNYPGVYPIHGTATLFDAIAMAGGFRTGYYRNSTTDLFDLTRAVLSRDGIPVPVDFEALFRRGEAQWNVELQHGDLIIVPSALRQKIYILGEVIWPRTYGFTGRVTLLQALTEARGLKETSGENALIIRGSIHQPDVGVFNIDDLLSAKESDVLLQPGDILFFPPKGTKTIRRLTQEAATAFVGAAASESANQLYDKTQPLGRKETK
jgi:polysaccharide biosynthesis/export protein